MEDVTEKACKAMLQRIFWKIEEMVERDLDDHLDQAYDLIYAVNLTTRKTQTEIQQYHESICDAAANLIIVMKRLEDRMT